MGYHGRGTQRRLEFAPDPKFGRRGQFGMEFDGTIVSGDFSSSQTIAGWLFGTVINNGY